MIDAGLDWATASGPPNGWFLLAVLTHPAVWTATLWRAVRKRLGWDVDGGGSS